VPPDAPQLPCRQVTAARRIPDRQLHGHHRAPLGAPSSRLRAAELVDIAVRLRAAELVRIGGWLWAAELVDITVRLRTAELVRIGGWLWAAELVDITVRLRTAKLVRHYRDLHPLLNGELADSYVRWTTGEPDLAHP
jgi:hypothetical protein